MSYASFSAGRARISDNKERAMPDKAFQWSILELNSSQFPRLPITHQE